MEVSENCVEPGCPWYGLYERFGPPNVKWCEERLCAWVNEPANTWSNIGYLAAGLWIVRRARAESSRPGEVFGWVVFAMGLGSLVYHATNNFLTQVGDFLGMFAMVYFIVAANLWRMGRTSNPGLWYAALVLGSTASLPFLNKAGFPIQWLMVVTAAMVIGSELLARRREAPGPWRSFAVAAVLLGVAESFSLADLKRLWCDPSNHWLQGHAVWHWLAALAMPFLYEHYAPHLRRAWSPARDG